MYRALNAHVWLALVGIGWDHEGGGTLPLSRTNLCFVEACLRGVCGCREEGVLWGCQKGGVSMPAGASKVRSGPATKLQPHLPSHGLHCRLSSIRFHCRPDSSIPVCRPLTSLDRAKGCQVAAGFRALSPGGATLVWVRVVAFVPCSMVEGEGGRFVGEGGMSVPLSAVAGCALVVSAPLSALTEFTFRKSPDREGWRVLATTDAGTRNPGPVGCRSPKCCGSVVEPDRLPEALFDEAWVCMRSA